MEPGQLARVLTDFFTTIDGELSLTKGDYFLLINVVDKIWCYGESRNKRGKFPLNNLHKVDTPNLSDDENLFISIAPFKGEQEGDLIFDQGEFIIGQQEIEPGWINGYIDERSGVFPMSHVWLIDKTILKKSGNKKVVRKKVKVKTSLKAQLDEELDLTEGDILTVIEILDDGWVRGITTDGRTGTFPEAFVEYINEDIDYVDEAAASASSASALSVHSIPETSNYQQPIYDNWIESSYHANEEPAPSYDDLFPVVKKINENIVTKKNDNVNLNSFDVKPYAITLYPFKAQYQDELNFEANEIVELTRHIDLDWLEGIIDNKKGMLPTSYVKIIVDCSEENRIDSNIKDEHDESIKNYIKLNDDSRVKVAYTFDAQMEEDLSVKEGEIVTIVKTINEGWVSVKNENGNIGLCPRGYLSDDTQMDNHIIDDSVDDFVVLKNIEKINSQINEEQNNKRVSIQPHRPAPPTPAPGSIPLQKLTINEKNKLIDQEINKFNDDDDDDDDGGMNEDELNIQKRFEKRQNIISELVITEKEYVRDLKVTYETFNLYDPSKLESRGIDVSILFGNILDVIHVAEDLLDSMLKSMKGKDESQQMIAPCFLNMSERLKTIYKKYCGNHEAALSLLKKYEDNKEIMNLFDKGIETLRHQVACFDMSSILIKPVQRILKYPLMLYELVKCTEDNHPDKKNIEEAWKVMTAVASYINEYKRRTDIVSKYLDIDNTLMSKMSKLNMHSVTKKSSRLSAKLSASFGLTNIPPDQDFDELEKQFKLIEKTTEQLHYDVEQCMNYLNEETVSSEVLSDFLNQYHHGVCDNEIRKFYDNRVIISTEFMKTLKDTVENRVNQPLMLLFQLLDGPSVLITKRYDKLLDYDNAISKSEKNKESRLIQNELAHAKSNYTALNQQLLEELPIFIDAANEILVTCIEAFANSRKLFYGKIMKRYLKLSETATQVTSQDILQSFLINHNLLWNQISRLNFDSNKQNIDIKIPELTTQSTKETSILFKKYQSHDLYIARESIVSTSTLNLSITKGTIVAVIKRTDPMNDSSRWYVDNGSTKGFIPSNILEPLPKPRQQLSQQYSNDIVDYCSNSIDSTINEEIKNDLINLDSPVKEKNKPLNFSQSNLYGNLDPLGNDDYEVSTKQQQQQQQQQRYANLENEFYVAAYPFDGLMPGTLALKKGQMVKLLRPHDEKGNSEWWLMENRHGFSGYVPKTYVNLFTKS